MNSTLVRAFTVAVIAVGATTMVYAQSSSPAGQSVVDRGKFEYRAHCAVCHGLTGKGDGPFVDLLKSGTVVTNLSELSKTNKGVFPFTRVYETIDGTVLLRAHGNKEMPVWGSRYRIEAGDSSYNESRADAEAFVRARILALTEYVYRLQTK